jgi:hypothetical protein
MDERRRPVLVVLGQRDPGLDPEERHRVALGLVIGALGMGDAVAGHHPVDRAGLDPGIGAEAVAVVHPAAEQVADGGQPDMRVRTHIHAARGQELGRAHLVEEDEGADHLPLRRGQRAAHLEPAQIAGTRDDHGVDGIDRIAGRAIWVEGGVPAHGISPAFTWVRR